LSMGKNTVALGLLFFIDSIPVLFGKITSKWKVFSILSSSFSSLGFGSHSFNFF
jgi:hypothetical protein